MELVDKYTKIKSPRIAAVVVTYNRKELLVNCLNAINEQSYKPQIIYVIDNASTDGTDLIMKSYVSVVHIEYIKLDENVGGAGGFYTGMKIAHEANLYDAVWVMDDDGIPDDNCLEHLADRLNQYAYLAPLVLDIDNRKNVAFPYMEEKTLSEIKAKYGSDGVIANYSNPFNGILYRIDLIDNIGYPMKEMFIWGDEVEYNKRCIVHGYTPYTIVNAIHLHPKDRLKFQKDLFGKETICDVDSDVRNYCKARNTAFLFKKYYPLKALVYNYITYVYYYVFCKKSYHGLVLYNRAFFSGILNRFNGHKKWYKIKKTLSNQRSMIYI